MVDLTHAQRARVAVQSFRTIAHALALRGYYRPSEKMGQSLAECLLNLSPEIYGSMNDPRVVELKGLEYVMDRLPRGIESATRIILTEEEQFEDSPFEKIIPLKRRRTCYRISDREMCLVVTRGLSEIYDILTHLTFLAVEARKISSRMRDETGSATIEWNELEQTVLHLETREGRELDQAIWNLSIILGRPYHETRQSWAYFERNRTIHNSVNSLFSTIYHLGKRVDDENRNKDNAVVVYLTPSLMTVIVHHQYGEKWATDIRAVLKTHSLSGRPLHIISANLHSVVNLLYGYAAIYGAGTRWGTTSQDLYAFIREIREKGDSILAYGKQHGLIEIPDRSGTHIDCQIIDTAQFGPDMTFHPDLHFGIPDASSEKPVLFVMDYAFGAQAFEVMDSLLGPEKNGDGALDIRSISIMGKAGILPGKKGDIMLATAHVLEGTSDNYTFENDLGAHDFDPDISVYTGPMITVVGTSLQNRAMLGRFQESWKTVGLEMEGAHYHRAISAARIKGHIPADVKVRYAYYASDNPLVSGQTLAAGEMGEEGIRPTYMVTKAICGKIFPPSAP